MRPEYPAQGGNGQPGKQGARLGRRWLLAAVLGLALLMLIGCNVTAIFPERPTIPPPPTLQPAPASTPTPIQIAPTATDTPAPPAGPLPTFTPRLRATADPNRPTRVPPTQPAGFPLPSGTPAETPAANPGGPIGFTYQITWELDPADRSQAVATVRITPSGGDGNYQYFRDEMPIGGPLFSYRWAVCAGNPGSLRVTSGDGQTLKLDYFEMPPCP